MMSVVVNTLKNKNVDNQRVSVHKAQRDFGGFDQLAHAYESLAISAAFKTSPEDFIVEERLPFGLSGEGEHAWLHIRKSGCNTDWVARKLAKVAGVRLRCVGYAGLKDRHGLTSQWFSVHLPGKQDPDWSLLESCESDSGDDLENNLGNNPEDNREQLEILETKRHSRKLRRGALKENRFYIRLRSFTSDGGHLADALPDELLRLIDERCQLIAESGVPNYFGEQRFGRAMGNLSSAMEMFGNKEIRFPRHKKSIYLSAARSWIFNRILSQRITTGCWNQRIAGDAFMLNGKSACFQDDDSDDLNERLEKGEIHPTSVLCGIGESMTMGESAELENDVINAFPEFRDGLCEFKVQQMRRALRVVPGDMIWTQEGNVFVLEFNLPAGSYATMVLRELFDLESPAQNC